MVGYDTLSNHYRTNFILSHVLKFASLTELDNMIGYEREIYITLMNEHLEEEKRKAAANARAR